MRSDTPMFPRGLPTMRPLVLCLAASLVGAPLQISAAPLPVAAPPDLIRPAAAIAPSSPQASTRVVTNCNDTGAGSLRDTIGAALSNDTVDLSQLSCSRITLASGQIVFGQANLAIVGPGAGRLTIDGGLNGGVLVALGGGTLQVRDVTIENGFKYRTDAHALGGCIQAQGNAIIRQVLLRNCSALSTGNRSALGGAVWTGGQLVLHHSVVTGSMAKATGWGYASGGGIYAHDSVDVEYSTISNNVAISESATPSFGGGMLAWNGGIILGSTISGNQAAVSGGLHLIGAAASQVTVLNSTVSGNVANRVGGIFAKIPLTLNNSTVAFNTSHQWDSGSGYSFAAGVHITVSGTLNSTIISNNLNTGAPAQFASADLAGKVGAGMMGGHNAVGLCLAPCPNDTSHDDPGLHPLQDNGGATRTHMPTPGQWDVLSGSNVSGWPWDQRGVGFPRQSPGDWLEIGAVQVNSDIVFANGFN